VTANLAVIEPLKMSGSKEREERAKRLAGLFVKFISEHTDLLVQVRGDFLAKQKHEKIMGCSTFTEYCVGVLHYSENHIAKIIKGRNPASEKHNGSANRKLAATAFIPPPAELLETNPALYERINNGTVVLREPVSANLSTPNINGDYFRHLGNLLDGVFKGQIKEKLDVLCKLPISKVTPKIKQDAKEMIEILQDVSISAEKYITKLEKISHAKVV